MSKNANASEDRAREYARSLERSLIVQSGAALSPHDFTSNDGLLVHYVSAEGSSSPILLIHGGTMGWGMWTSAIGGLARTHPVVAVDLPGCGLSGNADLSRVDLRRTFVSSVSDLVQSLGLRPAVVVGHSIGGWVASAFAIERPDLVSRLCLVNPAGVTRSIPLSARPLGAKPLQMILRHLRASESQLQHFVSRAVIRSDRLPTDFVPYEVAIHSIPGRQIPPVLIARFCSLSGINRLNLEDQLPQLRAPTLLISGARDRVFPPNFARRALSGLRDVEMIEYAEAGHLPNIDSPDRFSEDVARFARNG